MIFIGQNPSVGAYNILDDITIGSNTNGSIQFVIEWDCVLRLNLQTIYLSH